MEEIIETKNIKVNMLKGILIILIITLYLGVNAQAPNALELIGVHNVSKSDISTILNPIKGTIVYDTDDDRIYQYDGSNWLKLVVEKEIVKSLTSNYTISSADNGKALVVNSPSQVTLTIPSGLDIGFNLSVYQTGSGKVNFVGSGGVTLKNRLSRFKTAGIDAGVGILCTSSSTFHLTGDLKK